MKIAWVWIESEGRFCRLEELTPEEKLLRAIEAPAYGADIERTWEECTRREFDETMERRMLAQENGPDQPEESEEQC